MNEKGGIRFQYKRVPAAVKSAAAVSRRVNH
jgi:hypothetical protein